MEKTQLNELTEKVLTFRDARNWKQFHSPKNLAMGLSIEAAELQELFLWKKEQEIKDYLQTSKGHTRVGEELADVFIYLLYLAEACEIDLPKALGDKLVHNAEKYPVEKSYGSARKYNELNEA
ncbi:MAG: nucleotide pyrophosphohydrolase [Myxococcota bacterium]|nr:nucleotide pyrophosphohydrolase [Myxococcota bacterium]